MTRSFAITFDYRCPFARNAHEAVVAALRAGADLDVRFVAFSLDQAHVADGEPAAWERPPEQWGSGLRALLWGVTVRDLHHERFLDFHVGAFAARHDHGLRLRDEEVLRGVAEQAGLDPDQVAAEVAKGDALERVGAEHTEMVDGYGVFGVPTFVTGHDAVFVRLMERGRVDDLDRVLDLLAWDRLNELKHARIPR